jgi:PST family polysaccharide transporter
MKKRILRFLKTDLFKASYLNGIANIIRLLTGLISNKIVAKFLGPSGIALLGQFQNFSQMVLSLASVGINTGITKYVAEYNDDELSRKKILSTGFCMIVGGSVIAAMVVFWGKYYFSDTILNTRDYTFVFVLLAITLILFVLNSFFVAVLNGYKQFKKIVITNIASSVFSLGVAVVLIIRYGVYGAFLGTILSQTLVFFITLFWVTRYDWFSLKYLTTSFDKESMVKLLKFSLMAAVSLFSVLFIQLQVRTYIIQHLSVQDAGYWQGILRVCDLYISFVTTTLGIYYLPRLAELKTNSELRKEIFRGYKFILPIVIITSVVIFVLKNFIIVVLFTPAFNPMRPLFTFQLLGNIFKVAGWLLGYLMLAKAMTKTVIITEIAFGLLYYLLTVIFVNKFGVVGVTYSYCLNAVAYLITMLIIFRKLMFKEIKLKNTYDE